MQSTESLFLLTITTTTFLQIFVNAAILDSTPAAGWIVEYLETLFLR